jgi:hypothetical protein
VNYRILLFLILFFSLGASEKAFCDELFCQQWALNQLKAHSSDELLNQFKQVKDQLTNSYHLPPNYTSGYFARRIEPYLSKPHYTEIAQTEKLYRGMYLSLDQLETILKEGMQTEKVRWTAAGGGISFSSSATEASSYIFHAASNKKVGFGVVFQVKMTKKMELADDPVLNSTRTIFKSQVDIPREEIQKVFIWGEYGLESLEEILGKLQKGKLKPHDSWTNIFDQNQGFSR